MSGKELSVCSGAGIGDSCLWRRLMVGNAGVKPAKKTKDSLWDGLVRGDSVLCF